MGDTRRHEAFTRFISKTWPWVKDVLIVADGKAQIARRLADRGMRVRVIEADPRYKGQPHPGITYQEGWFDRDTPVHEQLIVAMHPDEATAEVILAANKNRLPFAVVPCCVLGPEAEGVRDNLFAWLKKLKTLAGECQQKELDIEGRNAVLYRRR